MEGEGTTAPKYLCPADEEEMKTGVNNEPVIFLEDSDLTPEIERNDFLKFKELVEDVKRESEAKEKA